MPSLMFDVAHLLAGSMLVLSFLLLYQDRIAAVINVFALQAIALALSVAWQALVQNAPALFVTSSLALVVKGFVVPTALHRIIRRLDFITPERVSTAYDEHAEILRALERGDVEAAELLVRQHIAASRVEIRRITLHKLNVAAQSASSLNEPRAETTTRRSRS